ncbi:MAG TPA: ABC transporter substrate-binding protein, partial [Microlunatus sp.]|nr:ABC transporter substrate-binding protein [Microlunatus sp.]
MNDQHDHDSLGADLKSAVTGWSPNRRRFLSVAGLAVGGAVVGTTAAGCGTAQTGNTSGGEEAKGRAGAAGETLFVGGHQWGPPNSFNPFGAVVAFPCAGGQPELIYEALIRFNMLDGALVPGLAKEVQQPDDSTLVLPMQDGTKWSDGSELTAEDAAFTFDLGKQTALPFSTIWDYVDSIEATDPRTLTIKIKAKPYNPNFVKNVLTTTYIVPKAIWSKFSPDKVTAEPNTAPVGSGPFKLDKADQTQVNLIRDDAYWGKDAFGTPPMKTINHPIFKANDDVALKLESG